MRLDCRRVIGATGAWRGRGNLDFMSGLFCCVSVLRQFFVLRTASVVGCVAATAKTIWVARQGLLCSLGYRVPLRTLQDRM